MKRIFPFFFLLMFLSLTADAQVNEMEVAQVPSPIKNTNYNSPDSADIIIRIRNVGPNTIQTFDSIRVRYTISQSDTAIQIDTTLFPGRPVVPNSLIQFTLRENYKFEGKGSFSVCADALGTILYPTNPSKFPGACSQFLVGIESVDLKPNKVYFSNGRLNFELQEAFAGQVLIFDITGKALQENVLRSNKKHSISFNTSAKGFYFLKIIDQSGNSSISKFVVN